MDEWTRAYEVLDVAWMRPEWSALLTVPFGAASLRPGLSLFFNREKIPTVGTLDPGLNHPSPPKNLGVLCVAEVHGLDDVYSKRSTECRSWTILSMSGSMSTLPDPLVSCRLRHPSIRTDPRSSTSLFLMANPLVPHVSTPVLVKPRSVGGSASRHPSVGGLFRSTWDPRNRASPNRPRFPAWGRPRRSGRPMKRNRQDRVGVTGARPPMPCKPQVARVVASWESAGHTTARDWVLCTVSGTTTSKPRISKTAVRDCQRDRSYESGLDVGHPGDRCRSGSRRSTLGENRMGQG